MLRTKLSHVNEGGVAAGIHTYIVAKIYGKQTGEWMYRHCHSYKSLHPTISRSWCPRLAVPGRCQELLPCSVWSQKMICHRLLSCLFEPVWSHLVRFPAPLEQHSELGNLTRSHQMVCDENGITCVLLSSRWFEQMCMWLYIPCVK